MTSAGPKPPTSKPDQHQDQHSTYTVCTQYHVAKRRHRGVFPVVLVPHGYSFALRGHFLGFYNQHRCLRYVYDFNRFKSPVKAFNVPGGHNSIFFNVAIGTLMPAKASYVSYHSVSRSRAEPCCCLLIDLSIDFSPLCDPSSSCSSKRVVMCLRAIMLGLYNGTAKTTPTSKVIYTTVFWEPFCIWMSMHYRTWVVMRQSTCGVNICIPFYGNQKRVKWIRDRI